MFEAGGRKRGRRQFKSDGGLRLCSSKPRGLLVDGVARVIEHVAYLALRAAPALLHVALELVGRALGAHLVVAGYVAAALLDGALRLFVSAFDLILIRNAHTHKILP